MKEICVLIAVTILGGGLAACGSADPPGSPHTGTSTSPTTIGQSSIPNSATAPGRYRKADGDEDQDDGYRGRSPGDDAYFLDAYGKDADQAEAHAIASLIRRYYSAAFAADGASACTMLYPSLAAGLTEGEENGSVGCAAFVSHMFKERHEQLAAEDPATMTVIRVLVKGDFGIAQLGFKATPQRVMLVEREGHDWRISGLFDSELP